MEKNMGHEMDTILQGYGISELWLRKDYLTTIWADRVHVKIMGKHHVRDAGPSIGTVPSALSLKTQMNRLDCSLCCSDACSRRAHSTC